MFDIKIKSHIETKNSHCKKQEQQTANLAVNSKIIMEVGAALPMEPVDIKVDVRTHENSIKNHPFASDHLSAPSSWADDERQHVTLDVVAT